MFLALKHRILPTKPVASTLESWSSGCRFLTNLALEQILLGLSRPKDERIFTNSARQQKELTQLRKEHPWLKAIPRHIQDQCLVRVDEAWQRCFNGSAGRPKFKKKDNFISLTEFDYKGFRVEEDKLIFPKLAPIKMILHREIQGKPKTCTILKDAEHWYVIIVCEIDDSLIEPTTNESAIGIDRGTVNLTADSEGTLVSNPKFLKNTEKLLRRAQRRLSRKKKGSNRRKKAKRRVTRLHQRVRFQRADFLHKLSNAYAKSHGTVVLEDLKTKNMIRSNCAKAIADAGWGMFAWMLEYKLKRRGGRLLKVNPAYSSQTCSQCSNIDRASRSGILFHCTGCGFVEHADLNAAIVILNRADRSVLPVEGHLGVQTQGSGKEKLRRCRRKNNNKGTEYVSV
jgi:putative transposase